MADCVDAFTNAVPFDVDDLAGWAVGLYDQNLRRPDLVRLVTWIRLERRPAGLIAEAAGHEPKLEAIAKAQAAGRIRRGDPLDLMALVIAMACTWSPASGIYTANRDPAVFPEPAAFNIHRPNLKEHLGFGFRTHFCLGAPLIRCEARVAIDQILDRMPNPRYAAGERYGYRATDPVAVRPKSHIVVECDH